MPFGPLRTILGVKLKKNRKNGYFLWVTPWPQWPHFDTYEWQTDAKFKISAPNYPWGHKNPKNDIWRHQRALTSDDLGWPRKGHNVRVNHGCYLPTPIHVHNITSINVEVRKFQALKRYGTQISLDMTLEIRSQVKGHSRYGLKIFKEGVKLFQGYHHRLQSTRVPVDKISSKSKL